MKTSNEISYEIKDEKTGTKAIVTLPDGIFNLSLVYKNGMNNVRTWEVKGSYPKDKYSISYEGGNLFILSKGGNYEVGTKLEHKAFGKGIVTNVNDNMVTIDFGKKGKKTMMKSILKNFIK